MSRTWVKLVLLAAWITLPAGAAEVNRSWEKLVDTVKVGKNVVVRRMNSLQVEGKLLAIGTDSISVRWKGAAEVIPRADVFRVRYANVRRRNALVGLGLGVGAGLALWAANPGTANPVAEAGAGVGFGGGVGAAIGALIPTGSPLYEALARPK